MSPLVWQTWATNGSIYVHDIAYVETDQGPVKLDFTPAQAKDITVIKAAGF